MERYVRLPDSLFDIRINQFGDLKSFELDKPKPNTYLNRKGYMASWYKRTDGANKVYRIHRMVATLFIPPPPHLKSYSVDELQVNHIDGNKLNNREDNLEWVTNAENMKHARETGLFQNEKPVLAMCVKSGRITRYKSISETCRNMGITVGNLSIHLNQKTAGCVIHRGYRFKYDNDREWCLTPIYPGVIVGLSYQYKLTARNTLTGEVWLFRSFQEVGVLLSLNVNIIKNNHTRHGSYKTNDGMWEFVLDQTNKSTTKQKPVVAYQRDTGTHIKFSSSRVCAKHFNIPHGKLFEHLNGYYAGMLPWQGFYFQYDTATPFPNVRFLLPSVDVIGRTINFIVYKENDKTPYLLTNLKDLSDYFSFNPVDIYHHRERVGRDIPFNGLLITDVSNIDISKTTATLRGNTE